MGTRAFGTGEKRIEIDEDLVRAVVDQVEDIARRLDRPIADDRVEVVALIALARSLADRFPVEDRKRIFEEGMAMATVLLAMSDEPE